MEVKGLQYPFSVVHYFIPEFITRLRRNREVVEKPSPRQSIAMCKLLLPAFIRKGYLSFGDLVKVAVSTSRINHKDLAERLAYEILLDEKDLERNDTLEIDDALLSLISQKSDDLISYTPIEDADKVESSGIPGSDIILFKDLTNQPDIGVGSGEDELLKLAIRKYKTQKEQVHRKRLAEYLKVILLKMGREFQRSVDMQQRLLLRPFEYGDDPDDIDEERSLENIFDQGKKMSEVAYQDFLLRTKEKKKKEIIFILDISNTMFYKLDGLTSIHYSILSLVPLLWSMHKEKYGVIYYESNSHIQKELFEDIDVDEIIDNLLFMVTATTGDVEKNVKGTRGSQAWGGTVPRMSLKWALDQLDSSNERIERICFYFSDFVLQDPTEDPNLENFTLVEKMVKKGIQVFACVSPLAKGKIFSPYTNDSLERIRIAGAKLIETRSSSEFLNSVQAHMEAF